MSELNFPSNPSPGDQYTSDIGTTYIFDGVKWVGKAQPGTAGTNSLQNGGNTVQIDGAGNFITPSFTLPNSVGNEGQVLKWPISGTTLEWGSPLIANTATLSENQGVNFYTGTEVLSLGVGVGANNDPGEIIATGEILAYYSDRRLKENVEVIDNALVKVISLNGVTYNANDLAKSFGYKKDKRTAGLFADEVEHVLKEAVKIAPFDTDVNGGSKSGENYKTVQYERLIPLLVEAIKELNQKVETLIVKQSESEK